VYSLKEVSVTQCNRIQVTLDSFPLERFGFPASDITLQNNAGEIKMKFSISMPLLDTFFLLVPSFIYS
jgi:hypothetical protein